MKYLEYPELEVLSRALTFELSECKVFTRLEAYSCKAVNKEKRLFKALESSYLLSASTSPPAYLDEALASPFGRLDQPSARKTLFLLIATLNGAFPDHDFSNVNPSDFVREPSAAMVLNSLTSTLQSLKSGTSLPNTLGAFPRSLEDTMLLPRSPTGNDARSTSTPYSSMTPGSGPFRNVTASLSSVLDGIVDVSDCEVYTFHPDMDSDPHASAEPDEEGGEVDQGDPYDEGYAVDSGGVVSRGGTPMEGGDIEMTDVPMFDEDIMQGGFVPRSASNEQDPAAKPTTSSPSLNNPQAPDETTVDEDDLGGAGAGLLWSTFSFFYNRRMKRILFVSVWSRKNTPGNQLAWNSPSLAASRPPPRLPSSQSLWEHAERLETPTPGASPAKDAHRGRKGANLLRTAEVNPYPTSPQIRRHRQAARGRSASNSPAPSALSPFPHAQQSAAAPGARAMPVTASQAAHPSLDAAMHSISAPAIGRPPPQQLVGSPPVIKRGSTQDKSQSTSSVGASKRSRV
ncbi:hypothetical protein MPSI1_002538 [Malassezia psittaci]|uniref:Uncharacterized protein n=1 Tax=Malassezia psittaci TaxID=1821823 RepID=A0AAF0JEM5_9BASI|nr:hypothetical protein MPSI1_002538 [Malassezia psittaci]